MPASPVPASWSPRKRARDLDRTEVWERLDLAHAEGQLDGEEYRTRTAAASTARTLGELTALVADLQVEPLPPKPLPLQPLPLKPLSSNPPPPESSPPQPYLPGRRRFRWSGLVLTIALFVMIPVTQCGGPSDDPPPAPALAAPSQEPVELHTPGGLRAFVAAVRTEFGTTEVVRAAINSDNAVVYLPVAGNLARMQESEYSGRFDAPDNFTTRDPDLPLIDLASLDVDALVALIDGAGGSLAVENPSNHYVFVTDTGDGPEVAVFASNEYGESGFLRARPDGQLIAIEPYEPG